jgi:hypothetical protein
MHRLAAVRLASFRADWVNAAAGRCSPAGALNNPHIDRADYSHS